MKKFIILSFALAIFVPLNSKPKKGKAPVQQEDLGNVLKKLDYSKPQEVIHKLQPSIDAIVKRGQPNGKDECEAVISYVSACKTLGDYDSCIASLNALEKKAGSDNFAFLIKLELADAYVRLNNSSELVMRLLREAVDIFVKETISGVEAFVSESRVDRNQCDFDRVKKHWLNATARLLNLLEFSLTVEMKLSLADTIRKTGLGIDTFDAWAIVVINNQKPKDALLTHLGAAFLVNYDVVAHCGHSGFFMGLYLDIVDGLLNEVRENAGAIKRRSLQGEVMRRRIKLFKDDAIINRAVEFYASLVADAKRRSEETQETNDINFYHTICSAYAWALFQAGNMEEATSFFGIAMASDFPIAYEESSLNYAILLKSVGNADDAIELLRRLTARIADAEKADKNHKSQFKKKAVRTCAEWLIAAGRFEEARKFIGSNYSAAPNVYMDLLIEAYIGENNAVMVGLLKDKHKLDDENIIAYALSLVRRLIGGGQVEMALTMFKRIAEQNPTSRQVAVACMDLGAELLSIERFDEALQLFEIIQDRQDLYGFQALTRIAGIYGLREETDQSEQVFMRALEVYAVLQDPDEDLRAVCASVHEALADISVKRARADEMREKEYLQQAIERITTMLEFERDQEKRAEAMFNLVRHHSLLGNNREAYDVVMPLAMRTPLDEYVVQARLFAAFLQLKMGDSVSIEIQVDEIELYEKLLRLPTLMPLLLLLAGNAHKRAGDSKKATEYYLQIINDERPEEHNIYVDFYAYLALFDLMLKDDIDRAIVIYTKLASYTKDSDIQLDPTHNLRLRFKLAARLQDLARTEEALNLLDARAIDVSEVLQNGVQMKVHAMRSEIFLNQKDFKKAIDEGVDALVYFKQLKKAPSSFKHLAALTHHNLSNIYFTQARERLKAVGRVTDFVFSGLMDLARKHYRSSLALQSDAALLESWRLRLVSHLCRLGFFKEALAELEPVLKSTDSELAMYARVTQVYVLMRLGQLNELVALDLKDDTWEEAFIHDLKPIVWLLLGDQIVESDRDGAIAYYKKILTFEDTFTDGFIGYMASIRMAYATLSLDPDEASGLLEAVRGKSFGIPEDSYRILLLLLLRQANNPEFKFSEFSQQLYDNLLKIIDGDLFPACKQLAYGLLYKLVCEFSKTPRSEYDQMTNTLADVMKNSTDVQLKKDSYQRMLALAFWYFDAKDYKRAVVCFSHCNAFSKEAGSRFWFTYAYALLNSGDLQAAGKIFVDLQATHPHDLQIVHSAKIGEARCADAWHKLGEVEDNSRMSRVASALLEEVAYDSSAQPGIKRIALDALLAGNPDGADKNRYLWTLRAMGNAGSLI